NDLSNKKSSSSILFDITTENSKIDKSLNDKEEKGAVFNLLGLTFHWACDCSSRSIDVQLWICHFVSCPHGLNMKNLFSVLFVIFNVLSYKQGICAMQCKDITTTSALTRLKDYLFCDYNREIRPTKHYNNATIINLGLNIQQFEVNDITNSVIFDVWLRLVWKDPHFTWDESQFDSITSLHVKSYEIWVPDIVTHSTTDTGVDVEMPQAECIVQHDGVILCVPMTTYATFCESDHTWWPYDMMNCTIHIASWSHGSNEISLRSFTLNDFSENSTEDNLEWEVVDLFKSERVIVSKYGLGFTTDQLSYHVLLRRHSSMNTTTYMTSAIVLMMMTLMVLWLEPRSTERMIISNLNFILHLFCLLDLQWKLPFNGTHPPRLILFYEKSLALATFSLILTSILRYMHEINAEAPAWISVTTVKVLKSRIGQIFLLSILDPKVSATIEMNVDDNTNLVSSNKKESTWRYTSVVIGWLAFLTVLFTYVILLIIFLPTSRFASSF
ncbi:neuronal acetylcholine receptor subunit alpha-5, partial [Bombus impatiens]|uniref:Neuronal acetylcholine receptor subunit alpha-5 n=1 Tax=Bombus impatiens TaxID=132113 RepID=A0A6P8L437_BOMIM